MNDNAIAAVGGTGRMALGGLAQRLVQDGLLDEVGHAGRRRQSEGKARSIW